MNDVVCFKIHTNKHGLPGCLSEISHQNQWVLLSWLKEMAHKSLRPQASAPLWKRIGYSLSVLVRVLKMLLPFLQVSIGFYWFLLVSIGFLLVFC